MKKKFVKITENRLILISILSILFAFIIGRWGIWNYFMFPNIGGDGFQYMEVVYEIWNGQLPTFHFIGPGYPFFILLSRVISNTLDATIYLQQAFSLVSILILVYSFKEKPNQLIAVTFFGIVYLLSDKTIRWETYLVPDNLISNGLILFSALFFLSIKRQNSFFPIASAFLIVFLIGVRSSSIFLIVIALLIAIFYIITKRKKHLIYFTSSILLCLFVFASYNYFFSIENKFNILTYGRSNSEFKYEEGLMQNKIPIKRISSNIIAPNNYKLAQLALSNLPEDSTIFKYFYSWNPKEITQSVLDCRFGINAYELNDSTFEICRMVLPSNDCPESKVCTAMKNKWKNSYTTTEIVGAINNNSNKSTFSPFEQTIRNALAYHFNISFPYGYVYYGNLKHTYLTTGSKTDQLIQYYYSDSKYLDIMNFIFRGNHEIPDELGFETRLKKMKQSIPFKLYDIYFVKIYQKIIFSNFWLYLSLIALIYYVLKSFINKNIESTNVYVFILCMIALGSSLIFAKYGNPLPRYAFTTEFTYYLVSFLFIAEICEFFLIKIKKK